MALGKTGFIEVFIVVLGSRSFGGFTTVFGSETGVLAEFFCLIEAEAILFVKAPTSEDALELTGEATEPEKREEAGVAFEGLARPR